MDVDARRALNNLKVQELKELCKEQGLPAGGRKLELIERLIHQRECHAGPSAGAPPGPTGSAPAPPRAPAAGPAHGRGQGVGGPGGRGRGRGPASGGRGLSSGARPRGAGAAGASDGSGGIGAGDQAAGSPAASRRRPLRCTCCSGRFDLLYTQDPKAFKCPACRVRLMDPFNVVVEPKGVLKLALFEQPLLDFALDVPDLRRLRRDGCEIELRMVRVDCSKIHHAWPQRLQLFANGHEIFTVNPPEEGHKRRDVPQGISAGLTHGINSISVQIQDEHVSDFVLAVVLTRPRGMAELSLQVGRCDEPAASARVQWLLAKQQSAGDSPSQEIVCLSSDTLRLLCPISMGRVEDPVRGVQCEHLQCFGFEAYVLSNRQMRAFNNRWQCPVCSLVLRPADLCRDVYVARVLASTPLDVEEVVVAADGAWRCREPAPEGRAPAPSPGGGAVDLDGGSAASPPARSAREAATPEAATPSLMALELSCERRPAGRRRREEGGGAGAEGGGAPRSTAWMTLPDSMTLQSLSEAKAESAATPRATRELGCELGALHPLAKRPRADVGSPEELGRPPAAAPRAPLHDQLLEISDED